ncbi:MAG: DUF2127 domain-containing protein, partial [Actinomycetes bacterium]
FEVFLILKGLDGLLEIAGGLVLLLTPTETLSNWLNKLTAPELAEDPHDFIASHVLTAGERLLSGSMLFAALYLLSHGVVKLVLVGAVLKDRIWAYPWMMAFLALFIGYQTWLLFSHATLGLWALTVFDCAMLWLTWREYGKHRARSATLAP